MVRRDGRCGISSFTKNVLRGIRGSLGRFFAIMGIVALGCGFYAGLQMCGPSMRRAADELYDGTELYDIRLVSTLGFTENDVRRVESQEGVMAVMPSVSVDAMARLGSEQLAVRLASLDVDAAAASEKTSATAIVSDAAGYLNRVFLREGRWPADADECVITADKPVAGTGVGDTIELLYGTNELDDILIARRLTVVGTVSSSVYPYTGSFGSTTLGSGMIGEYLYLAPEAFEEDLPYTELYLRVRDAERAESGSDAYEDTVHAVQDALDHKSDELAQARLADVRADAQDELDEGWQTYRTEEAEARQELKDARTGLDDALAELEDGEHKFADGQKEYDDGTRALASSRSELDAAAQTLRASRATLESSERELAQGESAWKDGWHKLVSGLGLPDSASFAEARSAVASAREELASGTAQLDAGIAQAAAAAEQAEAGLAQAQEAAEVASAHITQAEAGIAQLETGIAQVDAGIESARAAQAELEAGIAQLTAAREAAVQVGDATADAVLAAQLAEAQAQLGAVQTQLAEAQAQREALAAQLAQTQDGLATAREGLSAASEAAQTAQAGLEQARATQAALQKQRDELPDGSELDAAEKGIRELEKSRAALDEGASDIMAGRERLSEGEAEYASGMSQIAQAETELADAKMTLDQSRADLDDGWKTYHDGEREYEDAKRKADNKLADAKQELEDAQREIDDLEAPEIYALDRTKNEGIMTYDADSRRMDSIADVFPLIFFLVAALVSLTTMTRMVDDERIEIGTYKALGYSTARIASKYLVYAAAAGTVGAIVGIAVLCQILPVVVTSAYSIIYTVPLHPLPLPVDVGVAVVAGGLGVGVTLLATYAAVVASLKETPATLMLPRAPAAGKRILLERIGPMWRRLSFSWKVTCRNLFRYKRRFAMTVIGISGCTALLLVGLGLHDAIWDIIDCQYGPIIHYDTTVGLTDSATTGDVDEVVDYLEGTGEVKDIIRVQQENMLAGVSTTDETIRVQVIVPQSSAHIAQAVTFRERVSGSEIDFSDNAVLVTEKLALKYGLQSGDELLLYGQDTIGNASGAPHRLQITGVVENYVGNLVYIGRAAWKTVDEAEPVYTTLYASSEPSDSIRQSLADELRARDDVSTVLFSDETINLYRNMLSVVDMVVAVLVVSAGALAFIVLYNLTNINIGERVREIASLKVLGFTRGEVYAYIFREIALLAVIGDAVGMVLGTYLETFVATTAEVDYVMFGRTIHPLSYAAAFALTLVFSGLILLVMRHKLDRVNMVESLKSVE